MQSSIKVKNEGILHSAALKLSLQALAEAKSVAVSDMVNGSHYILGKSAPVTGSRGEG